MDELKNLGITYFSFPDVEGVNKLASERGYRNRDEITVSPKTMGDVYEEKVKSFFSEHLHEDEEIRYIRDGHGYFDVRSKGDQWIRIRVEKVSCDHNPPHPSHFQELQRGEGGLMMESG